ncbi:MAG: hypothetical protein ACI8RD_013684 [Bacillariaceae sp.]|jgi:hypothetical protein
MLDVGDSYTIDDYHGNGSTVTVKFDELSNGMKDARITLSSTPPPPTAAPTIACGGFGRFKVEIGIDNFQGETYWKLFEMGTNNLVEEGMDKEQYFKNKITMEPRDGTAFCLEPGSCYDFKIYDDYSDGLKPLQGGFYRGFLGEESGGASFMKIFEGAEFQSEDKRSFCVDDISTKSPSVSPTKAPVQSPTKAPTLPPTNAVSIDSPDGKCEDDASFVFKQSKTCAMGWIAADLENRCNKNAAQESAPDKLIKDYCKVLCNNCDSAVNDINNDSDPPPVTPSTSSCDDSIDFRFKGKRKKKCAWIGRHKKGKRKCKSKQKGIRIYNLCPSTCGSKFGVGKCADK